MRSEIAEPVFTSNVPKLGLVCITFGEEIRYRTITKARLTSFPPPRQVAVLSELYRENLRRLFGAVEWCRKNGVSLYRVTSNLFPLNDLPAGIKALDELRPHMATFGKIAERSGVRVVLHPDQFVVLNSMSPAVVAQSIGIMERHAYIFDALGLRRSPWAAMTLHGGKGGRSAELVETIRQLSRGIRKRLVLENDEHAYGAEEILGICRGAKVPMVFDLHHHVVKEKLAGYGDPSLAEFIAKARETWPRPEWQIVHLSNGANSFADPCHSKLIRELPKAIWAAPWIEVEAKGKEEALRALRGQYPSLC